MKTRLGFAVAIAALTALVVGGPALAQGYTETPTITTFDDDGDVTTLFEPGQAFEIGGRNFNPAFNDYKTTIEQNPTFDLGSITVRPDGTFLVTKTIPANIGIGQATLVLTGSGAGAPRVTHAIRIAEDVDDGAEDGRDDGGEEEEAARPSQEQSQQQEQNVNVADFTGTRSGANLPKTGSNTMDMAAVGGGLVLLGILLLLFSRRRGQRVPSGLLPPALELPPADTVQAEIVQDEIVQAEIVPDDLSSLPEAEQHLVEADILALSR